MVRMEDGEDYGADTDGGITEVWEEVWLLYVAGGEWQLKCGNGLCW